MRCAVFCIIPHSQNGSSAFFISHSHTHCGPGEVGQALMACLSIVRCSGLGYIGKACRIPASVTISGSDRSEPGRPTGRWLRTIVSGITARYYHPFATLCYLFRLLIRYLNPFHAAVPLHPHQQSTSFPFQSFPLPKPRPMTSVLRPSDS